MARRTLRTRFFQMFFRLSRPVTLGVRCMVFDTQGRVCLVRHTYTPGWYFPGGGVEKGELSQDSIARELVEEAGVRLTEAPRLTGVFANHSNFPNDHILVFEAAGWEPCEATSRGEIADCGWFAPDALPQDITAGTAARLAERSGHVPVSPFWTPEV